MSERIKNVSIGAAWGAAVFLMAWGLFDVGASVARLARMYFVCA